MKRILALLLIITLFFLAACNKADDAVEASFSDTDTTINPDAASDSDTLSDPLAYLELMTPFSDDEPEDEYPESTPIPVVALKDYTYETVTNDELGVSFKYPSFWINIPGEKTICYEQPVESGVVPARVAITYRPAGNIVVTQDVGMDKLTDYSKVIKKQYTNYKSKKKGRLKFANNTGFYFTYTAEKDGQKVQGYCAIAYAKVPKNSFYVFHFNSPSSEYKNFDPIRKNILKSVRIL